MAKKNAPSDFDLNDPLVKMALGVAGGIAAIVLFPKALKFTVRTAASIAVQALPIVVAGLLAEKAAETTTEREGAD